MLLQILFSIRLGRRLIRQTPYSVLNRWFIGCRTSDGGPTLTCPKKSVP